MSRWFRMYADAMRNPKVARLSDRDFRMWVTLLSVAAENDGVIPCLDDLKHVVSARLDHLSCAVDRLVSAGLIDALADGYEPHNWGKFQYKSDTSKERVTLHRARKRNNVVTPPDTEADTETEKEEEEGDAAVAATKFAFSGKTIRLTEIDLHRWRKTFHAVPDIEAELLALDSWWETQPEEKRKRWFHHTQGALNRKHQELLSARPKQPTVPL